MDQRKPPLDQQIAKAKDRGDEENKNRKPKPPKPDEGRGGRERTRE